MISRVTVTVIAVVTTLVWQVLLHVVFALIMIGGFWTTWDEAAAGEAETVAAATGMDGSAGDDDDPNPE